MNKIVFLDTETTGLDPNRHELLEVAMLVRTQSHPGSDLTINFSLNIDPLKADPKALEVNHYFERQDELLKMRISHALAGRFLLQQLTDAVVVGNNVQFDLRFVAEFLLTRTNVENCTPWHYNPVDIKALAAGKLGLGEPPWSTERIAQAANVPLPTDQHTAFADACWNRNVYDELFHYAPAMRASHRLEVE